MEDERLEILRMVETGQIDAQEAATLLSALQGPDPEPLEAPGSEDPLAELDGGEIMETLTEEPADHWRRFWIYPLMAGGGILLLGAILVAVLSATRAGRGWGICCGWIPIVLGAIVMLLAWWSRTARWLHVRIKEKGQRKIAFSLPVPLSLAAWGLRIAQPFVPQLRDTGVDDLIIALRDTPSGEAPITIDVQDGDDGEQVQLYFG